MNTSIWFTCGKNENSHSSSSAFFLTSPMPMPGPIPYINPQFSNSSYSSISFFDGANWEFYDDSSMNVVVFWSSNINSGVNFPNYVNTAIYPSVSVIYITKNNV